ncbi:hypothetical protein CY34DRAFT_800054 [Suillus luteus UH-Slu-Lm8-n1]|uniref:Uncharacterized protein n=1 Tax=Suillus luteus UH-Slu-Lm8-n1 TaxID=930992 RepID=A0A0D0A956_9AGAM|nr:hypothetical protein CY34DRAFT_800054 [Suillus luteus UH-Slu-Lm8-n1]
MNTPRGGRELKGVLGGLLPTANDNVSSTILCNLAWFQHSLAAGSSGYSEKRDTRGPC